MRETNSVILLLALMTNLNLFSQSDSAVTQTPNKDTLYNNVDEQAEFPGGDGALLKWLGKNVEYPQDAIDARIEGVVFVQFVVEEDGSISLSSIQTRKGAHPILDSAAIAAIYRMPRWIPAKYKGKAVRSVFIIPIMFQLPDVGNPSKAVKRRRK